MTINPSIYIKQNTFTEECAVEVIKILTSFGSKKALGKCCEVVRLTVVTESHVGRVFKKVQDILQKDSMLSHDVCRALSELAEEANIPDLRNLVIKALAKTANMIAKD